MPINSGINPRYLTYNKEEVQRLLDEVYHKSFVGYYVCESASNAIVKEVTAPGYTLSEGGSIKIKMLNSNMAILSPQMYVQLKIGDTPAARLYYAGDEVSSNNTWEPGEVVEVYYDGFSYYANNVAGGNGSGDGAFDLNAKDTTGFATLAAALAAADNMLSLGRKRGGMTIKFINSVTGKYEQWMLTATSWSTNTADWKAVENAILEGHYYNQ